MDMVVRGRLALPGGRLERGAFGVRDGKIVAVGRELDAGGAEVLDAGDALVLPGAVDAHVHFRDPGAPEKEDFLSGTTSAAFGGVTAVMDMPNTNPPTLTVEAFEDKLALVGEKAVVDFGLFAGLSSEPTVDFEALLDRATALKTYLGASTGNLLVTDPKVVARAIRLCAARGMVAAFHAESEACLVRHADAYDTDPGDYAAHSRARPPVCESESIEMLEGLDKPENARVHICHLSTADGLAVVERAGFTSEVCPHHLLFTIEDLARMGGTLKMNPPLRAPDDRETLWGALVDGRIPCLASDHAPHTPEEKRQGVQGCPSGVPGVETLLTVLLARAVRGELPLARLVEAACRAPADVYGLPKGRIEPGFDADFAIYEPERIERVRADRLHSRAGWTPYEGMDALFPTRVYVRGRPVVEEGRLVGEVGGGRFLAGGHEA